MFKRDIQPPQVVGRGRLAVLNARKLVRGVTAFRSNVRARPVVRTCARLVRMSMARPSPIGGPERPSCGRAGLRRTDESQVSSCPESVGFSGGLPRLGGEPSTMPTEGSGAEHQRPITVVLADGERLIRTASPKPSPVAGSNSLARPPAERTRSSSCSTCARTSCRWISGFRGFPASTRSSSSTGSLPPHASWP